MFPFTSIRFCHVGTILKFPRSLNWYRHDNNLWEMRETSQPYPFLTAALFCTSASILIDVRRRMQILQSFNRESPEVSIFLTLSYTFFSLGDVGQRAVPTSIRVESIRLVFSGCWGCSVSSDLFCLCAMDLRGKLEMVEGKRNFLVQHRVFYIIGHQARDWLPKEKTKPSTEQSG